MADLQAQVDQLRDRLDTLAAQFAAQEGKFLTIEKTLGDFGVMLKLAADNALSAKSWRRFMVLLLGGQFLMSAWGLFKPFVGL